MPTLKTEISELSVALGLLGVPLGNVVPWQDIASAIIRVTHKAHHGRLNDKLNQYLQCLWGFTCPKGLSVAQVRALWEAGRDLGQKLGPMAQQVVWSGPTHSAPGVVIPRDIQVGATFVSVKVGSNVMYNLSPFVLFRDFFSDGVVGSARRKLNWFQEVDPDLYRQAEAAYKQDKNTPLRIEMFRSVAKKSAQLFNDQWAEASMDKTRFKKLLANATKFFLRINNAPYYLVALEGKKRVVAFVPDITTFLHKWQHLEVEAAPDERAGQSEVLFYVRLRSGEREKNFRFHAEIRWSHGQFNGAPEAKLYKDFRYTDLIQSEVYYAL